MKTKNRRAVGTFGFVAIAAILTVAMVSANLTTQQVQADHEPAVAAKKAGMSAQQPTAAVSLLTQGSADPVSVVQQLGHFDIKSNDKGDWLIDATIECATATEVKATGKQSKTTGAFAGAKVWYELDGVPVSILTGDTVAKGPNGEIPSEATWNLCEQVFEMQSNFNDLITQCTEEQELAGECTAGDLVFVCDFETEVDANNDQCSQSLTVFSKNAGTHGATVMIHDVSAGESHTVSLNAILSHGGSVESTLETTNPDGSSLNFEDAGVIIGKRIVIAEPIHMQTVTTGN